MGVFRVVRAALILLQTALWSSCLLLVIAIKRLRKGPQVLQVKPRSRPACLDDPQLGTHRFSTVSGIKIHYVENGDKSKKLLVLIHGYPAFWYCWHYQLEELAKDYWVVAVDLRGYGESDKPAGRRHYARDLVAEDVAQLVVALGRHSCTVAGHDWGGLIAYRLAELRPAMVEKLIILNAPHADAYGRLLQTSLDQLLRSWYVFMFRLPWLPEAMLRLDDFSALDAVFASSAATRHHFPPQLLDAFKYTLGQPGALTPPVDYYRQAVSGGAAAAAVPPPRIVCPLLVLWADNDRWLSPLLATMPARYADHFTVRFVAGASHWVMMECPDLVNGYMRRFIDGVAVDDAGEPSAADGSS